MVTHYAVSLSVEEFRRHLIVLIVKDGACMVTWMDTQDAVECHYWVRFQYKLFTVSSLGFIGVIKVFSLEEKHLCLGFNVL